MILERIESLANMAENLLVGALALRERWRGDETRQ
jgi:hypothetical protein